MAKAFVESLLAKGIVSEDDVMVSSRSWATLEVMRERHHVHTTLSNREAVQFGDIVLLAVKPQNLERVFADIKGVMRPEQVLLSIVAGAGIDRLRAGTGHDRIVRCMPNTPAQIGAGVSVWTASSQVVQEDRTLVRSVLGAVGLEIEVDEERYVDMATPAIGLRDHAWVETTGLQTGIDAWHLGQANQAGPCTLGCHLCRSGLSL